jgi:hypothetical protein
MAEQLLKLSPDRDLQCYFLTPSAIAAMSQATPTGFAVSGKWRQQFDWAVVEWNRDNVFEHPALRYLPDGNLSGLTLSYTEQRTNCIPFESNLFPVVSWDTLRIWAPNPAGVETVYEIPIFYDEPLHNHATPVGNGYVPASGTMTLVGSPGAPNHVGLAFLEEHYYYVVGGADTLSSIAAGIAANINQGSVTFTATSDGPSVTVTYAPQAGKALYTNLQGANGNRIGMYGFAGGEATVWKVPSVMFSGGRFPQSYDVVFDFANLQYPAGTAPDITWQPVPTTNVRKMRWTWSADLQPGIFAQQEFSLAISNWAVTGSNRQYFVAGPGSRRIEDTDPSITYYPSPPPPTLLSPTGYWVTDIGNYSGGRIHYTYFEMASVLINYKEPLQHSLYLGSRCLSSGSRINVSVDGGTPQTFLLDIPGEDVLTRLPIGTYGAGQHTVVVTNLGNSKYTTPSVYFDFLEIAYPSENLPIFAPQPQLSLATDWDTYHSQSLPAERTAWLINTLGFTGRVNHYTGALWFYEIVRTGTQYATAAVTLTAGTFSGNPAVVLDIGPETVPPTSPTQISHLILPDDTAATVAQALACLINLGSNLVWASATNNVLSLTARAMGTEGNTVQVSLDPTSRDYTLSPASVLLSGGVDGTPYNLDSSDPLQQTLMQTADFWQTDLTAQPRINRAARDWHQAYFTALKGYGIDAVASFSTELLNADSSVSAGIAQRYPDGTPVVLNTPAIQTNFSPTSLSYWTQVYLDMAQLQNNAGFVPYLQAGEVQWWYYPKANVGMPFYDAYTTQQFQLQYSTAMKVILENTVDPSQYPNESAFLPGLIGAYTASIRGALQTKYPGCRFEVLYPTDTNDTPLNRVINYPNGDWTPANLTRLKTESFTFTLNRNLDQSVYSMGVSAAKGFFNQQRSHLVGISDSWTSWMKEVSYALAQGMDSVVLFALDQYCLIGYPAPPFLKMRSSRRLA